MRNKRLIGALGAVTLALVTLTACDQEQKNDAAQVAAEQHGPAEVGAMPDGFSNWATSCNHGNRVYTIYRTWNRETASPMYGAIAVVPADPTCAGK